MTLEEAAAATLEAADAAGATDAEAWAGERRGLEVRVYQEAVEALTDAGGRGLGLRVFVDGRTGYAYGTDLSAEGLRELAREAHASASAADVDEHDGLPDSFGATPVEGLQSDAIADWTTERKVELATAVDAAARAGEGVTQVPAARRRPADVRGDRGHERAQRRLRDGRSPAARALRRRLPRGASGRRARRRARRRR
jgi:predicted Zn-dependent protease